ncbi:uncharacterized mitochondrial protein AtMg00810-like [Solanum lycopersicum]|uniref:uncharacterized mitochondrial protein AtMg00810-like n=1 Tax=Solanum lycopersicum TaxID=4081 RepID=UPI00374A23E5
MKDLGMTNFCLGLQIENLSNEILVHQSTYTEKILKRFYMDNSHPLSTPMVVRSLDINTDPFRPQENDEELLGDETPYLSAIGALMYLANNTRPDICFAMQGIYQIRIKLDHKQAICLHVEIRQYLGDQ